MNVTTRATWIAMALVVISGVVYYASLTSTDLKNKEILKQIPSFSADDFSGEYFNSNGDLGYAIYSDQINYFSSQEKLSLTNIRLLYNDFDPKSKTFGSWELVAKSGEFVPEQYAKLYGHVEAKSKFPDAFISKVVTPELYFDLNTKTFSSKESVMIEGPDFVNRGSNYEVDLDNKRFVIKENSHAIYRPHSDGSSPKL